MQDLRVVQTGVQLLTGLLLTLPFQQGFDILELVAPVGMHRLLFAATTAKLWWPRRMAESAQSRCVGDNTS